MQCFSALQLFCDLPIIASVTHALCLPIINSKQQVLETLAACEIPPNARAEELTMERFGLLSDALFRKVNCIERR